jgi:hypothetical protein
MEKIKKFTWWIENHSFYETFDSKEEAIENAKLCRKNSSDQFEDYDESDHPDFVNIGEAEYFDVKHAVANAVDDIEDRLGSDLDDFAFSSELEPECSFNSKEDEENFRKEATELLLPLVEKYFYFAPDMVAIPIGRYDLINDKWED